MAIEIEAVIFDYGGVFTPSPFSAAHTYAEAQGVAPERVLATVFGDYQRDTDHPWHQLERGELDLTTALEKIGVEAKREGIKFDAADLFGGMSDDGIDRTVVVDHVRGLREMGLRTAILTNNVAEFSSVWRERLPVDELFDLVVDSSEEKIRKPNPEIYLRTLTRLGVSTPGAAIFLDDFAPNVDAARELGLHGILVDPDPRSALAALNDLLD